MSDRPRPTGAGLLVPTASLSALVLLAVIFRDRLINLLESLFSLSVVEVATFVFSTRDERLIAFGLCLILCAGLSALRPMSGIWWRTALSASVLAGLSAAVLFRAGQAHAIASACVLTLVFLAGNRRRASGRAPDPRLWRTVRRFVPSALVTSGLFALLLPYSTLARLEIRYFLDPFAEHIYGRDAVGLYSSADLAWLAFDSVRQQLYVCGNGTGVVMLLNAQDRTPSLRPTAIKTDSAQFCGFIPQRSELVVFQRESGVVSWVETTGMTVTRQANVGTIAAAGDETFIGYDALDDTLLLTSESGRAAALPPGVTVDASTGALRGRFGHGRGEISNIAMHPGGHFAYYAFFTGATGVVQFDVARREPVVTVQGDSRVDRLLVDERRNELLVASPVHSRVLVYDASTMAPKAPISTVFGARSLAIDQSRHVLLVTSLLSDELDAIDLDTRQSLARFRLGPWLRDVAIDEQRGLAYVTSRHGLFRVRYAERLRR